MKELLSRLRYGKPVIVVSGLPRSGTSMMMQMLEAGGAQILSDEIRKRDEDNPRGYYELERIKEIDKGGDKTWLREAKGKTIKVISFLLKFLPQDLHYKIIFMQRDMDEVLASQAKMLKNRNEQETSSPEDMKASYEKHLKDVMFFLRYRKNFDAIFVRYDEVVRNPLAEAQKIKDFLGVDLNVSAMATAVEQALYRNRKA